MNDLATDEDAPFSLTVPGNTFFDDDFIHGDSLTLSASLADGSILPDWLSFDAATGTFTGTPDNWEVGNYDIRVTATDLAGTSVPRTTLPLRSTTPTTPRYWPMPFPTRLATEGTAFAYALAGDTFPTTTPSTAIP